MAYLTYTPSLYRTGFRPYGQTNAWAASQLNGYSMREAALSGYLGQSHPFTDAGGWALHGLGQNKPFAPWVLHGLGDIYDPVTGQYVGTLSPSDNPVELPLAPDQATFNANPTAYSGIVPGGEAGASAANQVAAFGPGWNPATQSYSSPVNLPPGSSPRVNVPMTLFPQTAPMTRPAPSLLSGIPNIALYGVAAIAAIALVGGTERRRRR